MRIVCQDDHPLIFVARPFAGGPGANLYAVAVDPESDPGPQVLEHRRNRILDGQTGTIAGVADGFGLGATTVSKAAYVAQVDAPADELSIAIPDAWHGQAVWTQIRTFAADRENETIYRPRRIVLADDGTIDAVIRGTTTIIDTEKRDGGGLLVRFAYAPSRDGLPPTQFVLTKATGTGTITAGTIDYVSGVRRYEIELTGLTNAVAYTFALTGENGAVSQLLATIAFTGDSAGPPAVTAAVAVEV